MEMGQNGSGASQGSAITTTGGFSLWMAGGASKVEQLTELPTSSDSRRSKIRFHHTRLAATMLHLLGFDHERLTYRYAEGVITG